MKKSVPIAGALLLAAALAACEAALVASLEEAGLEVVREGI